MIATAPHRTIVLSPHLDDAAFSCGPWIAAMRRAGWPVEVVTCFTRSVPVPRGFALACQLDKGLAPDVDYMALRRREDRAWAETCGVDAVTHLPLAEAPHRGYDSAAALFAGVRGDDTAADALRAKLHDLLRDRSRASAAQSAPAPRLWLLAPLAIGDHVDHQIVRDAAAGAGARDGVAVSHYVDLPYAARRPPGAEIAAGFCRAGWPLPASDDDVEQALGAAQAYASQLGFQFGDAGRMRRTLRRAWSEDPGLFQLTPRVHAAERDT